jgi:MYXO-CTERM domain-containing protein
MATPGDAVQSRYNDLFANKEDAYGTVAKGSGDLAVEVSFKDADSGDLRLLDESRTTDRGDPSDDFAREPAPHGNRINMGAYAGTEHAELSQTSYIVASGSFHGPPPVQSPPPDTGTEVPGVTPFPGRAAIPAATSASDGCTVVPATGGGQGSWFVAALLALVLRRRRHRGIRFRGSSCGDRL